MIFLTIITATRNAETFLPSLILSLENQTDKNFEWIVSDCASTDNTIELIKNAKLPTIQFESSVDTGIYDGLNKAIKKCKTPFYLVLGADDYLIEATISYINSCINDGRDQFDFYTFDYTVNDMVLTLRKKWPPLVGPWRYLTGHAVGTVVKTSLHNKFGYYDTTYKISADAKFLMSCINSKPAIFHGKVCIGSYGSNGLSSKFFTMTLLEHYRAMVETGSNKFIQATLLYLRLLKHALTSNVG